MQKEFEKLKRSGVLGNPDIVDKRGTQPDETPDVSNEIMMLRYQGYFSAGLLEFYIDSRQRKNKIHTWPGCNKVTDVLNAPRLKLHSYSQRGEDRCQIIRDQRLWCRECNPEDLIVPWSLRHVD